MKFGKRTSGLILPPEPEREPGISDEQRNGSITAIGIVLGFSLTFMASWPQGDDPWEASGIAILAILGVGIILQIVSLWQLLVLPNTRGLKHDRRAHNSAVRLFGVGMAVVFAGFLVWVGVGMVRDFQRSATAAPQPESAVCQLLREGCSESR